MKWTKEKCKEDALKYKTRSEYNKGSTVSYNNARENKWLDEICSHMKRPLSHRFKWNKEKCHDEALKYETRSEYHKKSGSSYAASLKNKWIDEICSHMPKLKIRKDYWTKDNCRKLSLGCKTRTEFRKKYGPAHRISCKNGWIDEICSHMTINSNPKRCIYAYEFDDKSVYVGLTFNLKNRDNRHMNDNSSSVNIHIKKTKLVPILKQLTNYINIDESKSMEDFYLNEYKNNEWNILNKVKTGSIGGITLAWTKDKCIEVASTCENRSEFWEKYQGAVSSCKKNGWMKEIHMIIKCKTKEKNYWNNYDNCLNEAIKQKTMTNFRRNGSGAFKSSIKNGWKDKIYEHMKWNKTKHVT